MARYTSAKHRPSYTFDSAFEFKDAGALTADDAAQVDSADKIVDLGEGLFEGDLVVDITAIEIDTDNERYDICLQLSDSATFASGVVNGAILAVGAKETLIGTDTDSTTGRYVVPFRNEVNGVWYRYARVYVNVTGTLVTGIDFTAFAAKRN